MTDFTDPIQAAITNTQEGLEYFWANLPADYWSEGRLSLCDAVANKAASFIGPICKLLEAGCGDAHVTRAVLDTCTETSFQIAGFDWAVSAIKRAAEIVPEGFFFQWDLFRAWIPSDLFDLVLCVETLEHMTDYHTALNHLLDLCRSGGYLFITVPNGDRDTYVGHVNHWMPDTLRVLLSEHRRGADRHVETGFLLDDKFVYGVLQR